jgi:hypothetical protein
MEIAPVTEHTEHRAEAEWVRWAWKMFLQSVSRASARRAEVFCAQREPKATTNEAVSGVYDSRVEFVMEITSRQSLCHAFWEFVTFGTATGEEAIGNFTDVEFLTRGRGR